MPTYEYECDACDYAFEEFQSMSADPLKTCPECNKDALRRLIGGGAAIIFKGSGFYETDYRSESYKSGEKDATGGSSDSDSSSDSASDSDSSSSGSTGEDSGSKASDD